MEEKEFSKLYFAYLNYLDKKKEISFSRFKSESGNPRDFVSTENNTINVIDSKRNIRGVCTEKDLFVLYKEFGNDIYSIDKITRKWIGLRLKNSETKDEYINFFEYKKAIFIDLIEFKYSEPKTIQQRKSEFEKTVDIAKCLSENELKESAYQNKKPQKKIILQIVYERNPSVVALVLKRAKGICERCHNPGPFTTDSKNEYYLEVHHKKFLSEDGDDTVENCIALCANCHRHAHYGKNTYDKMK